jgi:hypothetical protein
MNTNNAHTNNADGANNTNANVDKSDDTDANDADAAYKANGNINTNKDNKLSEEVDPFLVLSCEERSQYLYIKKQRVLIRNRIQEFGLERVVHYTTFSPPLGFVYECALVDLLELDLIIYEIIYEREKRDVYYSYVRNFPGGTMILCADQYNMAEGPSSDDDEDEDDDDNNNRNNNGNGGKDSKSPDVNRKVRDKRPPDTDATLPLPTSKLARQADDLQARLSVFPNGHQGPSGDRLLAEMELELLKRGTE